MPKVIIEHGANVAGSCLDDLGANIQKIVAEELSCKDKGGGLLPEHVEVNFRENGPRDITNGYDVEVMIFANYFPSRNKNLKKRKKNIKARLDKLPKDEVTHYKSYVWIFLGHAEFAELWL